MAKRYFILTKDNVPLYSIKGLLGKLCFAAFDTIFNGDHIFFIDLVESMTSLELHQILLSIISDSNINVVEFDDSFVYTDCSIFVDPTIAQIEILLSSFFIGGWTIEKGEYNLYNKVISSRKDDCFHLACFLKHFGFVFSSSLEQLPIVEIQNLPPNFKIVHFNQINEQNLKIPTVCSTFINTPQNTIGYVLTKSVQDSENLIGKLNNSTISQNQLKAFRKYTSPLSFPSNMPFSSPSSIPPRPYQLLTNQQIPIQAQNNFYGPALVNNHLAPNPQLYPINPNPNTYPPINQQIPPTIPNKQSNVKEVLIYPSNLLKTVHVEQPSDVSTDRLRKMVEKFGAVDKFSIIETKSDSNVFEVVYNKVGSCDTILKSNQFKGCAKKADIHLSPVPISPVIQYYTEGEKITDPNASLFDVTSNTVIVALEKDDDLKTFSDKMANFGIFTRIVFQLFVDRKEVAVTFAQSGSLNTLLKCKEFQSSAVMAEELFKYRSSLQQQLQIQGQQMQRQQQIQINFQNQQQQLPNQIIFPPPVINAQPPFNFQHQPSQMNFQPPINFQQIPLPPQQQQFYPQQPNFQQFADPNNSNNSNPNFPTNVQRPYTQKQPLIVSSSQNSFNSESI